MADKMKVLQDWLIRAREVVRSLPVESLLVVSCYLVMMRSGDPENPIEGVVLERGNTIKIHPFSVRFTRTGALRIDCLDRENRWTCSMNMNTEIEKEGCFLGVFSSEDGAKRWARKKAHELKDSS